MANEPWNEVAYRFFAAMTGSGISPTNPNANPDSIHSQQLTAGTTEDNFTSQAGVNGFIVKNDPDSGVDVYIGPSDVTTANGYLLQPGEAISYGVTNASAIYAVTASGSATVYLTGN
jgi:hypothetical protein